MEFLVVSILFVVAVVGSGATFYTVGKQRGARQAVRALLALQGRRPSEVAVAQRIVEPPGHTRPMSHAPRSQRRFPRRDPRVFRLGGWVVAFALSSAPAAAGTFHYMDPSSGTASYTDDAGRVPAGVEWIMEPNRELADYPRLTLTSYQPQRTPAVESFVWIAPDDRAPCAVPTKALPPSPITVRREWRYEPNINGWSGDTYALFEVTRDGDGRVLRDEFVPTGRPASTTIKVKVKHLHHKKRSGRKHRGGKAVR